MSTLGDTTFDRLLNIQSYNDAALKDLVKRLTEEERELSRRRRLLHGEIDLVRAELVRRLRDKHQAGESLVSEGDLSELTAILSGRGPRDVPAPSRRETHEPDAPIDAGQTVRDRFHDLSANVRDERLIRYIEKQVSLGRKIDDIFADEYLVNLANETKRAELLQNPQVIKAVQESVKSEFAKYGAKRAGMNKPQAEQ
jgi:hypothetical protein